MNLLLPSERMCWKDSPRQLGFHWCCNDECGRDRISHWPFILWNTTEKLGTGPGIHVISCQLHWHTRILTLINAIWQLRDVGLKNHITDMMRELIIVKIDGYYKQLRIPCKIRFFPQKTSISITELLYILLYIKFILHTCWLEASSAVPLTEENSLWVCTVYFELFLQLIKSTHMGWAERHATLAGACSFLYQWETKKKSYTLHMWEVLWSGFTSRKQTPFGELNWMLKIGAIIR